MNDKSRLQRATMIAFLMGFVIFGTELALAQSSCPSSQALGNFEVSSNVAAAFSNDGNTTTYFFASLTNENPVNGVPGLIKYCVYPGGDQKPSDGNVQATGADGSDWTRKAGSRSFSFDRPKGNPSNIPFDGKTTVMGTATWTSAAPDNQTILLHINDSAVCAGLYGGNSGTCFVKPSQALPCDQGDTTVAYNAMPFGVVNCYKPSEAFEATATNEFGDEVQLAGTARQLVSLNVLFASYGCSVSGHWNTGTTDHCVTTPGATFAHPITANIYEVADCSGTPCPGALLASVTQTQTIPYRPSADAVKCPNGASQGIEAGSQWFNPLANAGAGGCEYKISKVLTFSFTGITLPGEVIWTVAFNTTHSGYAPLGQGELCFSTPGGCGYDSLNVGTMSFSGAPYAGTDVNEDVVFRSQWTNYPNLPLDPNIVLPPLQSETGWTGFRPLAEIITTE